MTNTNNSAGVFSIIGQVFGMASNVVNLGNTIIETADNSASRVSGQLSKGFDALDLVIDNSLLDFANDNIVQDAKRLVARKTAQIEAKTIIAGLEAK